MSLEPATGVSVPSGEEPRPGEGMPAAETVGAFLSRHRWGVALLAAAAVALFFPTLQKLVQFCLQKGEDFSYCLAVPCVSAWLLWSGRRSILALPLRGQIPGALITAASLLLWAFGYLTVRSVFQRLGMVGTALGLTTLLGGMEVLRRHPFPFLFLFLSVPVPYVIYLRISLALREFATVLSAGLLFGAGVPVMNDGNMLYVDGFPLKVAEACSGIRSLLAILTVAVLFCHLFRTGVGPGTVLVALSLPVTVLVNILRIFFIAYAIHLWGLDLTRGTIHESMGMILFALSLGLLYVDWLFVRWLFRLGGSREAARKGGGAPWTA